MDYGLCAKARQSAGGSSGRDEMRLVQTELDYDAAISLAFERVALGASVTQPEMLYRVSIWRRLAILVAPMKPNQLPFLVMERG